MKPILRRYLYLNLFLFWFAFIAVKSIAQVDTVSLKNVIIEGEKSKNSFDRKILENLPQVSISELFLHSSILQNRTNGLTGLASGSSSGSPASHLQLFWNGMPLNSPMNGIFDLNIFPAYLLDRMQVELSNSNQYSSDYAQTISMNSTLSSTSQSDVLFGFGSFGNMNIGSSVNFSTNSVKVKLKGYGSMANNSYDSDGHTISNSDKKVLGFSSSAKKQVNSKNSIQLNLLALNAKRQIPRIYNSSIDTFQNNQIDNQINAGLTHQFNSKNSKSKLLISGAFADIRYVDELRDEYNYSKTRSTFMQHTWEFNKNRFNFLLINQYQFANSSDKNYNSSNNTFNYRTKLQGNYSLFEDNLTIQLNNKFLVSKSTELFLPSASINWNFLGKKVNLKTVYFQDINLATLNDKYWVPGGNVSVLDEEVEAYSIELNTKAISKEKLIVLLNVQAKQKNIKNYIQWQPKGARWFVGNIENVQLKSFKPKVNIRYLNSKKINVDFTSEAEWVKNTGRNNDIPFNLILFPNFTSHNRFNFKYKNNGYGVYFSHYGTRFLSTVSSRVLEPYQLIDIYLKRELNFAKGTYITLWGKNILNQHYYTIPQLPMPGINFEASLRIKI